MCTASKQVSRPAHSVASTLVWCLVMVSSITAFAQSDNPPAASYRVEVPAIQPSPRALVTATMHLTSGKLAMATGGGIDHLPNHWTTFVEDLSVEDAAGEALTVEHLGPEGWRIPGGYEGEVQVRYAVDLSFTLEAWPPGNEQAGMASGDSLYVITKPLFIAPSTPGPLDVTFVVPEDWNISTPWEPLADKRSYRARDTADLTENSLVLGHHTEYRFDEGPFSLSLALIGPIAASQDLLAATLGSVVSHALDVFPETKKSRFLMTVFLAEQDDGESFETSAAFTMAKQPSPGSIMLWGNNLAHEFYHLWIGGLIHGTDADDHEWFDEGFTDYYADLSLVQANLMTEEQFHRKLEKVIGRYVYSKFSSLFPAQSLAEASANKGRYRFAVYDGGWAAAFCLDTAILAASGGARSLDDVMRLLYRRFALPNRAFTLKELESTASEAAGLDLGDFFSRHVHGEKTLPVEQCLQSIGLEGHFQPYAAELWITARTGASEVENQLHSWVLDGR